VRDVAAVVIGPRDAWERPGVRDRVAAVAAAPTLAGIRDAARGVDASLIWLLDSAATPSDGALAALLDVGHTPAVSLPVDDAGRPVEALLGRFTDEKAGILDAVGRACVPLRHTNVISMLIERGSLLERDEPDVAGLGAYAGTEWTARVFARTPALLVPASTVRPGALPPRSPREALRMTRTGVWRRGETLRELERCLLDGRRRR
jgi:hypothetical protein